MRFLESLSTIWSLNIAFELSFAEGTAMQDPIELREKARLCQRAAEKTADQRRKERLTSQASEFAQLADAVGNGSDAHSESP
jgi:hypothetical protein